MPFVYFDYQGLMELDSHNSVRALILFTRALASLKGIQSSISTISITSNDDTLGLNIDAILAAASEVVNYAKESSSATSRQRVGLGEDGVYEGTMRTASGESVIDVVQRNVKTAMSAVLKSRS